MKTKYEINQTVLLRCVVKGIRIDEDGRTYYFLNAKANRPYAYEENMSVEEDQIVCGWIRKGGNE